MPRERRVAGQACDQGVQVVGHGYGTVVASGSVALTKADNGPRGPSSQNRLSPSHSPVRMTAARDEDALAPAHGAAQLSRKQRRPLAAALMGEGVHVGHDGHRQVVKSRAFERLCATAAGRQPSAGCGRLRRR